MRIAYFDCSYGVAGDMILGALVDAGAPGGELARALEDGLKVEGLRVSSEPVTRSGVTATRVSVEVDPAHDHHRHLANVLAIVEGTPFSDSVKERAARTFRLLAEAEAKVHDTTPEKIHFHEVGCIDAIADVTGAMLALEMLGIERVESSPLALGTGTTRCAHGVIPVPAPATVELLRGVPTRGSGFEMEMTTPTGAAVLRAVCSAFGPQPTMETDKIGYGSGSRGIEGHANFLRVFVGNASAETSGAKPPGGLHARRLALLMTEVDDMSPELLGDLLERLFTAGCLDAHFAPIQMKKNRPAVQIHVLCDPERRDEFAELLLRHSSTFGLKVLEVDRLCLQRRQEIIDTPLGSLDVKVGLWNGETLKVTPEDESCRRLAEDSGLPLGEVYARAQVAILSHAQPETPKPE